MTEYSIRLIEDTDIVTLDAASYKIPLDEGGQLYFYNDQREVIAIFNPVKWTIMYLTGTLT